MSDLHVKPYILQKLLTPGEGTTEHLGIRHFRIRLNVTQNFIMYFMFFLHFRAKGADLVSPYEKLGGVPQKGG